MTLQMLAVYDSKARAYLPPIFVPHMDVALRAFANAANTPEHQIGRNPEDFTMFLLGSWNDDHATFQLLAEPLAQGLAASFKKSAQL